MILVYIVDIVYVVATAFSTRKRKKIYYYVAEYMPYTTTYLGSFLERSKCE